MTAYSTHAFDPTQAQSFTLGVQQFDSSLGTLTGVSMNYHVGYSVIVQVTNGNPFQSIDWYTGVNVSVTNPEGSASSTTAIDPSALNAISVRNDVNGSSQFKSTSGYTASFPFAAVTTAQLADYIGTGTVNFSGSTGAMQFLFGHKPAGTLSVTPDPSPRQLGAAFNNFQWNTLEVAVTYTYTAAEVAPVPEPASLAVWSLVAGIFGVGGIRKRLQRTSAV